MHCSLETPIACEFCIFVVRKCILFEPTHMHDLKYATIATAVSTTL